MARAAGEHNESVVEEIVYDSQEEQDQWPDSQPLDSNPSNAVVVPVPTPRLKTYPRQRKYKSHSKTAPADDFLSKIDSSPEPRPNSPEPTQKSSNSKPQEDDHPSPTTSSHQASQAPSNGTTGTRTEKGRVRDIFDFDSSDDDLPLLPPSSRPRTPTSSIPPLPSNHASPISEAHQETNSPPRRALRARKPEQQMPYTLDLMRHRDQFRRRGLKPVHNPDAAPPARVQEDDEQYQADEEQELEIDQDERYIPPKDVEERPPKRRRIEKEPGEGEEEEEEIRIRTGRRKFIDPRQFDLPRKERHVQQATPEREEEDTDYDFTFDDGGGFGSAPISTSPFRRISPIIHSPQQTVTPISNAHTSSSPFTNAQTNISRNQTIYIPSESSESEGSESPPSRLPQRHAPSPSFPSSASDTDQLERFKKKARGVLPGSFFTMKSKPISKPIPSRHTTDSHDPERKGVAKTKRNPIVGKPTRFAYPVSSDEEERPATPPREKRNFVDLTREEMIQNDVEGWDIEEDLIDRMLNWGGGGGASTRRGKVKSRTRKEKRSQLPTTTTKKRKRQRRRINEFTIPTSATTTTATAPRKRGPKLSIVDACDMYKAKTQRSPPEFMRLAKRQGQTAKNFARRRPPTPSRFSFAEQEDQEDVRTVITEWENGTIADGLEQRVWVKPPRRPSNKNRSSGTSTQRPFGVGPRKTSIRRTPLAPLQEEENVAAEEDANRPTVNKFIRPGAPIIAIVDGSKSRGRVLQNNAAYSTGIVEGVTRVRVPPPQRTVAKPFPRRPNDIATWLQQTRSLDPAFDDEGGFPDTVDNSFSPPPAPHHRPPRIRKPRRPVRHDINRFDKRFRPGVQVDVEAPHQLSLDDVWFPNDSTSLTFGVIAMTEGVYLDSTTLIGKGLVSIALKTKSTVEPGNSLWAERERQPALDVDVACEKLATSLDQILDSIDDIRLSDRQDAAINRVHRQVLSFAEFVISNLSRLTSVDDIQIFGSKQIRLTEIAMDRLDGTVLSGSLDLNDQLILLALSVFQTLLVACYQICILTSHDLSILGADQVMSKLGRRLLQYLVKGGFESVQQVIRRMRARSSSEDGLGCDSILIDVWSTLYHVLCASNEPLSQKITSFWLLLQSELGIEGKNDGKILDRAWYTLMNISAITVFDISGIGRPPSNRSKETTSDTIWTIVESIINPFLQSYSTVQHHRYDTYIRTLFGRCHTLISTWGWTHGAKTILTTFYNFFVDRRFDNLKTEAFGGFPKFFQTPPPLEMHSTDNTFVIFLKLLVSYITQHQTYNSKPGLSRREMLAGTKDLDRFVNRVTPLRTYQSTFAPLDYIALQNHYCLLLTLYWVAPERSRPSVERIRDVIDIEMAPAPAQVICMETWKLLAQLQMQKKEEIGSIVDWFALMFRHAMKEYESAAKTTNTEDTGLTAVHIKSKVRALESILLKSLQALEDIVPLAGESVGPLVEDVTSLVVKQSQQSPSNVMRALLTVVNSFFSSVDKLDSGVTVVTLPAPDHDSQDYGDATFMEAFVAAQDTSSSFPVGLIVSNISGNLFQVISNVFATPQPTNDNLKDIIDSWILGVSILVRHQQLDWTTFMQYGGEWERLRSANTKASRAWCPYILSKILSADAAAYFQGEDHFISAWFESIIEPDLARQHSLTELLFNINDGSTILPRSLFVRNATGKYEITNEALFEARPALIVHALANAGKYFENLLREGDHAAISICKQRYLDYLHRMLLSMKTIYLEMKAQESENLVQYISLAQHVVGNIIQYCSAFLKEIDRTFKDLPMLDYFTSGETFPQPGSNEIGYAAQRLRGIARKDVGRVFSHATQTDVFWGVKSFLEKCVQSAKEGEFVEFCVLALCEGDEMVGDHVAGLRRFVVRDIFCEYLRIVKEAPEVGNPGWGYGLVCLRAVREVYACVWEAMVRENVSGLKAFLEDLWEMMIVMCGITVIIAGQAHRQEGGLYTIVCARIFDFVILVDHIVFYTKDVLQIRENVNKLEKMMDIFRYTARGIDAPLKKRLWIDGAMAEESRGNGYMQAMVRREIRILQFDIVDIPKAKMDQLHHTLLGDQSGDSGPCFDETVEMYI